MKRISTIIITGICLGLILLLLKIMLGIDDAAFLRGYWSAAPAIVIGVLVIYGGYHLFYFNKFKSIARLLEEEKPQEYVSEMERLLKAAKGEALKNSLEGNLAVGYLAAKQFDRAIPILEKLAHQQCRRSDVHVAYKMNLCLAYFKAEQYKQAMLIYKDNQALFQQYRQHAIYGGHIAGLEVIDAMLNQQYDRAEELLKDARDMYQHSRLQVLFQEIFDILNQARAESLAQNKTPKS